MSDIAALSASIQEIKKIVESMQDRDLQLRVHKVLTSIENFENLLGQIRTLAESKDHKEIITMIDGK